jgi:hypothetical protein
MGIFDATSGLIGQATNMARIKQAQNAGRIAQQGGLKFGSMIKGMTGAPAGVQDASTVKPGFFANNAGLSMMNPQNLNNNMIQKPQTPINPKAFSNQGTIANMYGQAMPGTFNRSVSPLAQAIDPLTNQVIDPTMDQGVDNMDPTIQGGGPIPPPTGVQTPIAPIYDALNQ